MLFMKRERMRLCGRDIFSLHHFQLQGFFVCWCFVLFSLFNFFRGKGCWNAARQVDGWKEAEIEIEGAEVRVRPGGTRTTHCLPHTHRGKKCGAVACHCQSLSHRGVDGHLVRSAFIYRGRTRTERRGQGGRCTETTGSRAKHGRRNTSRTKCAEMDVDTFDCSQKKHRLQSTMLLLYIYFFN